MKPITELHAALQHPNVQAWLRVIRHGETHDADAGAYMALYGWILGRPEHTFTDFTQHPRVYTKLKDGRRTSAAGAYQIVYQTWLGLRKRRPGVYADFSPRMQDLAAVDLTDGRRALDDVLAGRLADAIEKCRHEWTSLPGAMESRYTLKQAERVFVLWDGKLADGNAPV